MNRLYELREKANREGLTRQEKAELLTAIQEKGRREGLTDEEKAELLRTARQLHLESDFATLEKQVRMLRELAERSPVIRGEASSAIVGALLPEAEYVVIERAQLNVLLEGVDVHVSLVKDRIMEKHGEPTDSDSGE